MMKQTKWILAILGAVLITGCVPQDVTGHYQSTEKQSILVKKDGEVLWRPAGDEAEYEHLGILSFDRRTKQSHLVTASAHPFMGTEIKFEDDLRTLHIEWRTLSRKEYKIDGRASKYKKQKE